MTTKAQQFTAELKALVLKYRPEVRVDRGYYGDIYGINFTVDGVVCATNDNDRDTWWDFGDGLKSLDEIAKKELNNPDDRTR